MKLHVVSDILHKIEGLIQQVELDQAKHESRLKGIHKVHRRSAANLLEYLSLRSHDLRKLQHDLGYLGMSRLARAEAHTLASLRTTRFYLKCLLGQEAIWPKGHTISIKKSEKQLTENTQRLFGTPPSNRRQRIMVTMPGLVADDLHLIEKMIREGMNISRINCAHDDPDTWLKIIQNIKKCDKKLGSSTCISMDISGPKIRTGELPKPLKIKPGDHFRLSKQIKLGRPKIVDEDGSLLAHASIPCTMPEVFDYLKVGDRVYFDDGIIKGKIIELDPDEAMIEVIRAKNQHAKLKVDKGVNFPDSDLHIKGLTQTDKENLKFIATHADVVNYSFVNSREDVQEMHELMRELNVMKSLGVVYKIETRKAYKRLVDILLEAMKAPKVGVMIARGDLAIETGWNKIGYIQKEMLAICNSCHIPIIWATQVLENLAKKGLPSRSEITDTVNATKAECIMLNKGPHILRAIQLLDEIIVNMEQYQDKNAPILPKLRS